MLAVWDHNNKNNGLMSINKTIGMYKAGMSHLKSILHPSIDCWMQCNIYASWVPSKLVGINTIGKEY